MEEITDNRENTGSEVGYKKPPKEHQFKPGQSGNPGGRPKGSLKDYVKRKLAEMSEEEKEKFLNDIPKDLQWRMSEGNPSGDDKVQATVKIIISNETDDEDINN